MNQDDLAVAILRISEVVTYFPHGGMVKSELGRMLPKMIGTKDETYVDRTWTPKDRLDWITDALIYGVGKWPEGGLAEVRGLYCRKFKPADGIETECTLPGFTHESRSPFLGAAPVEHPYLPQPGDEPVGEEFMKQIADVAKAKRIGGAR